MYPERGAEPLFPWGAWPCRKTAPVERAAGEGRTPTGDGRLRFMVATAAAAGADMACTRAEGIENTPDSCR